MHARFRLSVANLVVRIERRPVRLEEIPRIADSHPFSLAEGNRPNSSPLSHQQAKRICEFKLPTLRFAGLPYGGEDGIVENVDARVDHSDIAASHFLADRDNIPPFDLQRTEARRVLDLRRTHQHILRLRRLDEPVEGLLIIV